MKLSRLHLKTLREAPNEAELVSHKLMIRANLIKKEAAGIYTFMPFGWRTIRKIEEIVRQEQDRIGCQELHMPHVIHPSCGRSPADGTLTDQSYGESRTEW